MKTLFYIIFTFMIPASVVLAADSDTQTNEIFSNNLLGKLPSLNHWNDDTDVAWKNAFINHHGKPNNGIRIHAGNLFGQDIYMSFLYKKDEKNVFHFPDNENIFFNHEYYEIGSHIKGDWGNITLSFENSQIESYQGKPSLLDPGTFQDKPFLPSRISKKRTNGHGRLNLAEGVGLEIELEYLLNDSLGLDDSSLNLPTMAYSADLNTQFGNLSTRTVYFHMDRNHDFSRYGDYSFHPFRNKGFRPLYILTGAQSDIFTEDGVENSFSTETRKAGIDGIAFVADYKASPRIELHTAIGAANADKTPLGYDDYYGWEANMGIGYKILNNLTYELHLGYMATGDFFRNGDDDIETEDITIITQHLTMKF